MLGNFNTTQRSFNKHQNGAHTTGEQVEIRMH